MLRDTTLSKTNNKIMRKALLAILVLLAIYGFLHLFVFSKDPTGDIKYQKEINSNYGVYAFPVPEKVTFAGEVIPVEKFDVRESVDYEILKICYWHSELFLYLKRGARFFPVIEPILKKHNIPDDFKYLAVTESGLANVVSPAGARGFWQFMDGTAKEFKLETNSEVDERYHLEKATEAACKLLKRQYAQYKSWALVAAAYNVGPGRLSKRLKEQGEDSYYDLRVNTETGRYFYRMAAMKIIMQNPHNYGFKVRKRDLYYPVKTFNAEVDSSIQSLPDFARHFKTNYKVLKLLNPWLRSDKLTNKRKKKYYIAIPEEGARSFDYSKQFKERDSILKSDE